MWLIYAMKFMKWIYGVFLLVGFWIGLLDMVYQASWAVYGM
jgi:hypothetical protein